MIKRALLVLLILLSTLNAAVTIKDNIEKYEHFELQYFNNETSSLDIKNIKKVSLTGTSFILKKTLLS